MPHIIIEHSSNIKNSDIISLQKEIQNVMSSITEGNFDADQCKARAHSFDEYLVGKPDQHNASFIHITIKILSGRSLEVRKKLGEKLMELTKGFFEKLEFSPTVKEELIEATKNIADAISGMRHPQMPVVNKNLLEKRCDISVDIVEMDRETYQKVRIGQ